MSIYGTTKIGHAYEIMELIAYIHTGLDKIA